MAGRPSLFSQEIADTICERLTNGESLRGICKSDDLPAAGTVLRWLTEEDKAAFRDQYTRARDAQADALVEECLEIADDATNDWMVRNADGDNVGWSVNGEHVTRSRLRVDTRKWWAARIAPKKYGDKVSTEISGPDGGPINIGRIERVILGE